MSLSVADLQFITAQDEQSYLSKRVNHENGPSTIVQPACTKLIRISKQRSQNILAIDTPPTRPHPNLSLEPQSARDAPFP